MIEFKYLRKAEVVNAFQITKANRADKTEWPEWFKKLIESASIIANDNDIYSLLYLDASHHFQTIWWDSFIIQDVNGQITVMNEFDFKRKHESILF